MRLLARKYFGSGSFLIGAIVVSNIINLVYNAFFGRYLTFEQFGLLTLTNTFLYISNIVFSAVSSTINARTAFLVARHGHEAGATFYKRMMRKFAYITIAIMGVWIILSGVIEQFFHLQVIYPVLAFLPVFLVSSFASVGAGFLQGQFLFHYIGTFYLIEAVSKFVVSLILAKLHLEAYMYFSVPASVIISALTTILSATYIYKKLPAAPTHAFRFPKRFFFASILTGLATNSFLSIDILLIQHYFTAAQAGIYAFLALVGKMIYFFGSLFSKFIISIISRDEGAKRDTRSHFQLIFLATVALTSSACIGLIFLGPVLLPHIFGDKIAQIRPYLTTYALAISFYTLGATINTYHLARKHYEFSFVALSMTVLLTIAISLFHGSITQVSRAILFVSIVNILTISAFHAIRQNGVAVFSNIFDFFRLFTPIAPQKKIKKGKLRILIFNWRDMKHKYAGGAELYLHELGKRWVKDGNAVTIFCGSDGKSAKYEMVDGMQIIRRGGFYMVYIWAFLYYFFRLRGHYDIIIDSENGIPFFTPLYARKEKKFLLMHHVHQEVFRKSLVFPFSWIASLLEIKLMPIVYKNIQFITVSESTRHDVITQKLTDKEPLIIKSGVDFKKYKPGKKSLHPLVLYVGRLKYYKSINIFIKAAKQLQARYPKASFVIAGNGEEGARLKKYAHRLGVNVRFTGHISETEKVNLYQQAWVVVNPSSMEGWSITVIEANACGTPVIGSNVSGLKDSIKDGMTGYLVEYGNVNAFAQAIKKVLNSKSVRIKLNNHATQWAKQHSWDKNAHLSLKHFALEKDYSVVKVGKLAPSI